MHKILIITLKTLAWIAGVIVALLLLIRIIGGPIAKQIVEKHSPEWVHRQITLNQPSINLFNGSVSLTNVRMYEEDGSTDFVGFDSLYVQINLFRLLSKEVYLKHIWLSGLDAHIINQGEAFNFQDIIDHFSTPDSLQTEPTDTTSSGWGIGLYDIRIQRSDLSYADLGRQSHWQLEHINIEVPGLYFGKDKTQAGLSFDFPDQGGSLGLEGHFDQNTSLFSLDLDLDSIRLDMAMPFVRDYANLSSIGTRLTGCIRLSGSIDRPGEIGAGGFIRLKDTDIRDLNDHSLLTLQHVGVALDTIDLGKMQVLIDSINIHGLRTTFDLWSDHNTLTDLLVPDTEASDSVATHPADTVVAMEGTYSDLTVSAPVEKKEFDLLVRHISVRDLNVTYNDHTMAAPFSYEVNKIGLSAHNVSLHGDNDIHLFCDLPDGGMLMAGWTGGLDLHKGQEKLSITVKNMQLNHFSPYLEHYCATPLISGSLSLLAEERLNNGQLRGTNKVDIYGMTCGNKIVPSDAEYKAIPVKLAVSVLEDLEHKIQLSVPIEGDINNPEFKLRKQIWKTIGNILLKATASPWVKLGKAFGLGGDDMSKLDIDPLQPDFTSEQYAKIDKLVELMQQEEELILAMTQLFSQEKAVQEQISFDRKRAYYEQRYGAIERLSLADIEDIRAIKATDKDYKAFLDEHPAPDNAADIAAEEVMQLAAIREKLLLYYLLQQKGLPADRVQVTTADIPSRQTYSGKPLFKIGE